MQHREGKLSITRTPKWMGGPASWRGALQENQPVSSLHEPLHWRAQCGPKAKMLFLQIFSTERRVVGLCWEKSKPKGPKESGPASSRGQHRPRRDVADDAHHTLEGMREGVRGCARGCDARRQTCIIERAP